MLLPILFFAIVFAIVLSFFLTLVWGILLSVFLPIAIAFVAVDVWAKLKMKQIRYAPIPCKVCGGMMHILPETENSRCLNSSQQFEKQLRSADYDVFRCNNCQREEVFKIELISKYADCSKCGTKSSIQKKQKTINRATYSSSGIKEVEYSCLFCQFMETKQEVIPRLQHSSSSSGGFSRGGSSGGSFGGGRSGGGGSTSRW
jgi:uncharacterized protein